MYYTHKFFSFFFIVFLILSTSTLTFSQIDTTGFSLDIGNRWYYRNTTKGAAPYKYVKTIIGADTTGSYIVKVGKLGQDSLGIEKWKVVNGSFLINGVVQYDALRTRDTSWYNVIPYWGTEDGSIKLRSVNLFGFNLKCQLYYFHQSRFVAESWSWKYVALGVGNYFEQIEGYGGENYSYKITTELIGVVINGVSFGDTLLTSIENETIAPIEFKLHQNFPNPFNPTTNITYNLKEPSFVTLTLYNILGEEVQRLVNSFQSEGSYNLTFNGNGLASGMYIYRLETKSEDGKINFVDSKKMMILK